MNIISLCKHLKPPEQTESQERWNFKFNTINFKKAFSSFWNYECNRVEMMIIKLRLSAPGCLCSVCYFLTVLLWHWPNNSPLTGPSPPLWSHRPLIGQRLPLLSSHWLTEPGNFKVRARLFSWVSWAQRVWSVEGSPHLMTSKQQSQEREQDPSPDTMTISSRHDNCTSAPVSYYLVRCGLKVEIRCSQVVKASRPQHDARSRVVG